jgi:two-component system CheB/CheR fusion protein
MSTQEREQTQFDVLLEYLQRTRGFDFGGYKRVGLMRRVQKRMQSLGVSDFAGYVDYLEVHPDEFDHLFNTILINVTAFFRDSEVWEHVQAEIVPRIVSNKSDDQPVRVWSAGCASGEEAYSAAMMFAEAMGLRRACDRLKVYATDVDEQALAQARQAVYSEKDLEPISAPLRDKYFEPTDGRYVFNKELRRCMIFGRHDLLSDAPISRVDLLVCRNALMYFNAEAQTKILTRFHFALSDNGYLFLGKAETLLTRANLFTPVDLRRRIFQKVPKLNLRDRLLILTESGGYDVPPPIPINHERLREASFEAMPVAQITLDENSVMIMANERARWMFGLTPRDVGRPLQDLEISYRPTELRSLVERVRDERRAATVKEIEWVRQSGERMILDLQVIPLTNVLGGGDGDGNGGIGVTIVYSDVSAQRKLREDVTRQHQELEAAYEEVQSTSEELETTNEELQSTVEELETTNEELQSTNEELETMNEELQSANEELETINEELRNRSLELNRANSFLESV